MDEALFIVNVKDWYALEDSGLEHECVLEVDRVRLTLVLAVVTVNGHEQVEASGRLGYLRVGRLRFSLDHLPLGGAGGRLGRSGSRDARGTRLVTTVKIQV